MKRVNRNIEKKNSVNGNTKFDLSKNPGNHSAGKLIRKNSNLIFIGDSLEFNT
jgi:hypothetical protein